MQIISQTLFDYVYAQDVDGKALYRFHLKSLALSNMAYFESPLAAELSLIRRRLFSDRVYMNVIFESIYTVNWFDAIWEIIESRGGWQSLGREYKEKVVVMCRRCLWSASEYILDKLDASLDYGDADDCAYLGEVLQNYHFECGSERLIAIYNKMAKRNHAGVEHTSLLHRILKENPAFVCAELRRDIEAQLEAQRERFLPKIELDNRARELYKELLRSHRDVAIEHLVSTLSLIYEHTQWSVAEQEICGSTEMSYFRRGDGHHFISSFVEDAINVLIDELLKDVRSDKSQSLIADFSRSRYGCFVFIALYIYTSHPDLFKDAACDIITSRSVLTDAPSWVEYQAVEALRATFPLMNDAQRRLVIGRVMSADSWSQEVLHTFANAYVASPLSRHSLRRFVEFLGGYAIKDSIQTLLMEELKKSLPLGAPRGEGVGQDGDSTNTKPSLSREVNQSGEKSVYIENNKGTIIIN